MNGHKTQVIANFFFPYERAVKFVSHTSFTEVYNKKETHLQWIQF
jgi:hypothetical protein